MPVLYEKRNHVGWLTLSRPEARNCWGDDFNEEIAARCDEMASDPDVRVAVLTGDEAGAAFSAGANLKNPRTHSQASMAEFIEALPQRHRSAGQVLTEFPKPVIAAVNGFALGGGCELAMACHIRIASENAKFGQPEVKLGIAPGYGGTQRLPRLVGKGVAMQLILTGEMIDAQEAYRIGLVNKVVPAANLLAESEKMMRGILAMGPLAVRLAMEAVDQGLEMTLDEGLLLEANHFGLLAATQDMKEGTTAFLEKRTARFQGR